MDVAFREINGVRTRVITVQGSGTPILLLHGFSDHAAGWMPFLRIMEQQGHSAVAFDLPGFGRADHLPPGPVLPHLVAFAAEAIRVVARETGTPLVVGNSLGGAAAWAAAQDGRLPLAGIVAIAPAGFGFTKPVRATRWLFAHGPAILRVPPLPVPMLQFFARLGFAHGSGAGRQLDPDVGRAWLGQFHTREDIRRTVDLVGRVLEEIDAVGKLPLPPFPVLLVWGGRDRLVRPDKSFRTFNGTESLVVQGWGHCPQMHDPAPLAALVLSFKARLPAGQTWSHA